jgi:competence protein ComEA
MINKKRLLAMIIVVAVLSTFCAAIAAEKININKASIEELATLKKIGPKIAERIVQYREENGDFKSIEDIKNVKGIGEKTFEMIQDSISVE